MNKNIVTIRQVQEKDLEALALFLEENDRPEIKRQFHPFPLTSQTARQIASAGQLDRYYVTIVNGKIVGLCMLRGWDEGFEIPSFGVLVDHRHQGLGLSRQMTEFAIAEARRLSCHTIRLSVYASNIRAVQLYESLGFREICREPALVERDRDLKLTMTKELKNEHID